MTDTEMPDSGNTSNPPEYVAPATDSEQTTTPDVPRETADDAVARAQAALDAAIAQRDATSTAAATAPVDSVSESQAAVTAAPVGTTPVGVAPVAIGPSGMPVIVHPSTVEQLVGDVERLKDEAKAAISELVKYSRMPEESRMRAVETALHALIQKVL